MSFSVQVHWLPVIYLLAHSAFVLASDSIHRTRLLLVNLVIALLFLLQISQEQSLFEGGLPAGRIVFLWSPIVFYWWAYTWARHTLHAVHEPGFFLDRRIIELEGRWFGQPSLEWARKGGRGVTEIMQFAYFSYFLYTFSLGFYLHFSQRIPEFQAMAFSVAFGYLVSYTCFPLFPTMGPRWGLVGEGLMRHEEQIQEGYLFAYLTQKIMYNDIAHRGGAMPSAHSSTAVVFFVWCWRIWGWEGGIPALILALAMALGAVYGRYHYVTDILVGAALGVLAIGLGDYLILSSP